jgi:hypothetical protein
MMRILRSILAGIRELMLELSDQRAYARHLEAHGAKDCGEEWRKFSDERLRARYQQVKCC